MEILNSLFISQNSVTVAERMCNRDVACVLESCINMPFSFIVIQSFGCQRVFVLSLSTTDMFLFVQISLASCFPLQEEGNICCVTVWVGGSFQHVHINTCVQKTPLILARRTLLMWYSVWKANRTALSSNNMTLLSHGDVV